MSPWDRFRVWWNMSRPKMTISFALFALGPLMACVLAGRPQTSMPPMSTPLPASSATTVSPSPIPPTQTPTLTPRQDIESRLARCQVTVAGITDQSIDELRPILAAIETLGGKTPELVGLDREVEADRCSAVITVFGPTVFQLYPERSKVDGVHYAINCGWEGRGAQGCQNLDIYPEQEFPQGAWLILLAGEPLLDDYKNTALVIHEMSHNLTWGGGHNPANVGGLSYPLYVGDDFAIRYIDALGVQLGSDSYRDEAARRANPGWRAEITADAVASWALDLIQGPYAESVGAYIHDMLVCKGMGGSGC
jgi:hypothetical protein